MKVAGSAGLAALITKIKASFISVTDVEQTTELSIDATPTSGSSNLITSGGVYSAIPNVSGKADKVANPTSGDFAGLDANGNLTDSGKKASDFSKVSVSNEGTATDEISYITIDSVEKKIAGGSGEDVNAVHYTEDSNKTAEQKTQARTNINAQEKITANGVLQGDGNGGVTAKTVDSTPTSGSNNLVTSGGVYAAIPTDEIEYFTYNVSTYEEIVAAYTNGKTLKLNMSVGGGRTLIFDLVLSRSSGESYLFSFAANDNQTNYTIDLSPTGWGELAYSTIPDDADEITYDSSAASHTSGSVGEAIATLNADKVSYPNHPSDNKFYAMKNDAWTEFSGGGGGGTWGSITGTITNQTDLVNNFLQSDDSAAGSAETINADTLGGHPASYFQTALNGTVEFWTFTLDDQSTVTKKVLVLP